MPKRLALFDLDGTLLPGDSDHAFGEFLVARGDVDGAAFRRRNDAFYADYQAGRLDIHAYIDFITAGWRGRPAAEVAALSRRYIDEVIRPMLRPQAQELVERHRRAGDLLALVTATNDFVTRPIAALFGIEVLIATELERDAAGRPSGAIRGVPAFREGKVARVRDWLATLGHRIGDFETSTFYSDSTNDLPLLEQVSHPVATNPGAALERVARERGWPVLELFK
jgi:HAD superfamily hydrolase (TIGR01490 family)